MAAITPEDYIRYLVEARRTAANAAYYATPAVPVEQVKANMLKCRKALNLPLVCPNSATSPP